MENEHTEHSHTKSKCAFCEASETMERVMGAFGPSEEASNHFRQSKVEFLKGIRAMLDDQIQDMARPKKGTRVVID